MSRIFAIAFCISTLALNQFCKGQNISLPNPYVKSWDGFVEKNKGLKDSHAHNFKVVLKNDSVISVGGQIDYHDTYYLRVWIPQVMGILPADTKSIIREPKKQKELVGMPYDTCWLFKIGAGRINYYSIFAEPEIFYAKAIQFGDGPIVPLTQSSLLPMVADDPKASKLAEQGNLLKAIEVYNRIK